MDLDLDLRKIVEMSLTIVVILAQNAENQKKENEMEMTTLSFLNVTILSEGLIWFILHPIFAVYDIIKVFKKISSAETIKKKTQFSYILSLC